MVPSRAEGAGDAQVMLKMFTVTDHLPALEAAAVSHFGTGAFSLKHSLYVVRWLMYVAKSQSPHSLWNGAKPQQPHKPSAYISVYPISQEESNIFTLGVWGWSLLVAEEECKGLYRAVPPPRGEAATSHSTSAFPRVTEQQLTDEHKYKVITLPLWWQLSNFNIQLYANRQSLGQGG